MNGTDLSAALSAALRRAGLSTRALSKRSGLPERTTGRIVRGEQVINLNQASALASALGNRLGDMINQVLEEHETVGSAEFESGNVAESATRSALT